MTADVRAFLNSVPDTRVSRALNGVFDRILPTNLDTAITAKAGGVQATAKLLKAETAFHEVTTVATAADAVALPPANVGEYHFVKNSAALSMQVFGSGTDTIDSVATATGVAQAAGDAVLYVCLVGGNYIRLGGVSATETFGAITGTDDVSIAKTITSATPATERLIRGAVTLTPATTTAVAAGGSIAGTRGEITLTAGKSFTDGFLYGSQGKVTMNGTMAEVSAARIAGVLGQVDLSTGTLTAGQVSAVWGDLQGNPTLTVNDQVYVGRFTNSMSAGKKAQAFNLFYGAADFMFEASADGGTADWVVVAAVGGSQSHKLKVNVMGTTFYIPLHTA